MIQMLICGSMTKNSEKDKKNIQNPSCYQSREKYSVGWSFYSKILPKTEARPLVLLIL